MDDVQEDVADNSNQKETFRSTQSLGLITQKFMSLRHKNEVMNLNEVSKELCIPKRRVYDVVNVLEGLGYVEKAEKNNIKWRGDEHTSSYRATVEAAVEKLRQQERILELMLSDAQSVLKLHFEDPISRPYNYIRKADIRHASSPDSKSIIVKSEMDTNSTFEVQVADPMACEDSHEMIVRNAKGIKSHALLFTHDSEATTSTNFDVKTEESDPYMTLASMSTDPIVESHVKQEDIDIDDLETFVIPSSSSYPPTSEYVPETPGRGLLISPFKSLIDPTCILPPFSEDHGYVQISNIPTESQTETAQESSYIMEMLHE